MSSDCVSASLKWNLQMNFIWTVVVLAWALCICNIPDTVTRYRVAGLVVASSMYAVCYAYIPTWMWWYKWGIVIFALFIAASHTCEYWTKNKEIPVAKKIKTIGFFFWLGMLFCAHFFLSLWRP